MALKTSYWPDRPLAVFFGGLLAALGAVFLLLPGPGVLLLVAGLALLSAEYAWARRMQRKIRDFFRRRGW